MLNSFFLLFSYPYFSLCLLVTLRHKGPFNKFVASHFNRNLFAIQTIPYISFPLLAKFSVVDLVVDDSRDGAIDEEKLVFYV